jgi:ribonuclease J
MSDKKLRIIPLGGLGEVGKNMMVYEYGDNILIVDTGLMFPENDMLGIDYIIPDYQYLLERRHLVRGIVITHGHEDHTGALPYLLKALERQVPVLGTKLTLGLIRGKLEEHRIKMKSVKLQEIHGGSHVAMGPFAFDFFAVNHSIPDGVGVFVHTPAGNVVHTGDFKLDQTPIDGRLVDYGALTRFAKMGVDVLMSDSTNAESPGITQSEASVGPVLREIIENAEGRVIAASFSSHIHRIQQICDAAVGAGRRVAFAGRSMLTNTDIARKLGYLVIDEKNIIDASQASRMQPRKVLVMCTGSQGEPLSALARMANGDHKTVTIEERDTVVIAATPVPGNEKAVNRVINRLAKAGAAVAHRGTLHVHVSGHGAAEELKLMLNLVRPRFFVPVHGETRHLVAHARLAEDVGISRKNVFVLGNGDCLELSKSGARLAESVEHGVVYVDGLGVGDVGQVVLRDRQLLAKDGIVTVVVTIDAQSGRLVAEPDVITRGLALGAGGDSLIADAQRHIAQTLTKTHEEGVTDQAVIRRAVHNALSQLLWERTRSRPMVIPIVVEV